MKSNKLFILVIFSFLTITSTFAEGRGKQQLIQPDSFIYDALTAFSIETGSVNLADQAPISITEAEYFMSKYDFEKLSPAAQSYYQQIQDYLSEEILGLKTDIISLGARLEVNLEGYYKTNPDTDWIYAYQDRKALLALPLFIELSDYLTMEMIAEGQQNKGARIHNDNYSNIPINVDQIDINFPSYGYLSTGYSITPETHLNLMIGLGPQFVGRSINGSVIMSENFTGASYFNFRILNENFKYNMNVTQFDVDKYMYTHSEDFRLFNKLQFSISESMLVYAPLELRFLNPLTIFHGFAPWLDYTGSKYKESNTCAYMCFKIAYTPVRYLRIYGLFAQDQYQTKHERVYSPKDTTPNAISAQLGLESFIPFSNGYFHTWLEGCYTDPFMYIKESPDWSLVRTYRENFGDLATFYEWVGSPVGPDTISGQFNFGYEVPNKYSLTLTYLFMAKGEYSGNNVFVKDLNWGGHLRGKPNLKYWAYPNAENNSNFEEAKRRQALIAPSGTPEYVNRVSLFGTFTLNDWVSFASQTSFTTYINRKNVYGVNVCSGEFALTANFKVLNAF